jgi:hypothetical protein
MKASTIQWHLARDNQLQLARFCDRNRVVSEVAEQYQVDGRGYFTILYRFDNGAYIKAEMLTGDTRSYTVADHFQVVDYALECKHHNFNEYFEKCDDCGIKLEEMPKHIQRDYYAVFEDGDEPRTRTE